MILEVQAPDMIDIMETDSMMKVLYRDPEKPSIRSMVVVVDDLVLMQKEVWAYLDIGSDWDASDSATVDRCWLLKAATINATLVRMAHNGILLIHNINLVRYRIELLQSVDLLFEALGTDNSEALVMMVRLSKVVATHFGERLQQPIVRDARGCLPLLQPLDAERCWGRTIYIRLPIAITLGLITGGSTVWTSLANKVSDSDKDNFGLLVAKSYVSFDWFCDDRRFDDIQPADRITAAKGFEWFRREMWCVEKSEAKYPPLRSVAILDSQHLTRLREEVENNDNYKQVGIDIDVRKLFEHYRNLVVSWEPREQNTANDQTSEEYVPAEVVSYPERL